MHMREGEEKERRKDAYERRTDGREQNFQREREGETGKWTDR